MVKGHTECQLHKGCDIYHLLSLLNPSEDESKLLAPWKAKILWNWYYMYVAAVEYTVSPKKVTGDLYFYQKNNGKIEPSLWN